MKINQNMSAVLTNKQLLRTENKLSASMERLSSGLKLNRAEDSPAGMAISNKMRAQIDALDQSTDNASNAISTLQIADGALNEVSNILQRMRELSVQAANGTNSKSDRESIQAEIEELKKEVDRISADTEYNTKPLLDGSSDIRVYAEPKNATRIHTSDSVATGKYTIDVEQPGTQATWNVGVGATLVQGEITINDVCMTVSAGTTRDEFLKQLRETADEAGCKLNIDENSGAVSVCSTQYGSKAEIALEVSRDLAQQLGVDGIAGAKLDDETQKTYQVAIAGTDADVRIPSNFADAGFSVTATAHADGNRVFLTDMHGFSIDFLLDASYDAAGTADAVNGNFTLDVTDIGSMTIQIGGNQYQTMEVRISEVSTESLYLDTVDVIPVGGAERAMVTLDEAIASLNETRSRIGAFQNRLEYASASLAETEEDMTAAYSNILDTNMAEEMTTYTQQNVLQQAAVSVLAQANEMPQTVLSLLQ